MSGMAENPDIHIKVTTDFEELELKVSLANTYRDLMHLIKDRVSIEGFGQCGGMGRCGTCLVEVCNDHGELMCHDRNEAATLEKMGIEPSGRRLSCQVLVTEALDGIELRIREA